MIADGSQKKRGGEIGEFSVYKRGGRGGGERTLSLLFLPNIARDNLNDCPPQEFPLTTATRGESDHLKSDKIVQSVKAEQRSENDPVIFIVPDRQTDRQRTTYEVPTDELNLSN